MKLKKNDATVLLRLPAELKAKLTREALLNGRRITAEMNIRLANSFKSTASGSAPVSGAYPVARATVVHTEEGGALELTEIQRAMLSVFDRLGPEKQLALLSLFK